MPVDRLHKLRRVIAREGLDGLLVSKPVNCRYVSGFTGSSGAVLVSHKHAILATDFRYIEQAGHETRNLEITRTEGDLHDWLPQLVSSLGWHSLGFEANHICFAVHRQLKHAIRAKQLNLELIPRTGLVEHLRSTKEPGELGLIVQAANLTDAAFKQARTSIHPGTTEKSLAWEIENLLREGGSEGVPFDLVVASGPNAALPHAKPSDRVIGQKEAVIIDMGARIEGYCSDFSRTLCLGRADEALAEIHRVVLEAQLAGIRQITAKLTGAEADQLARTIIEQGGRGEAFGHGLGHGVGLEVHEAPRIGPNSSDLLIDGMVFTIEPGIYVPGFGGCRIEDVVVLEKGRVRVLTESEKTMEVIQ
ncbi:MAG: aminopeptidase P family protein [Dehalococcoidia bacterium]|nr:aminopeptidase P family protein [Dehalococcoidia bacterium]